ncbi:uncharacterized protein LOC109818364 [Cajanus cajan]|uniref:uncharacterized protein LOC109818364 n=1 Tax=Cajanus cajan TaxID=3821 RepID=UPI00098D76A2|nr:uncharacterized protein LOC109818364 [Cajanus cajan]
MGKFWVFLNVRCWTNSKQRSIINFLVNSSSGTMFLRSVDAFDYVKTGEKIFELIYSIVEEIREEKVVQVITDNGNLMLEDIGKLPNIKKTIQQAISLVGFIYSHSSTLSMLRFFTGVRELVRHAITRFATSYLSLERIHQEKTNLRKMFMSEEWNENKLAKEAKGKEATKTVLMPSFWKNVVFIMKVMAPLVKVLRLVDSEKKPAMGYICEAMDKAKETIMKSFKNESKYKDVFAIIDKRWDIQLHHPLHAFGHFLNLEFFYANPQMEFNGEIIRGLYDCINKLLGDLEMEKIVHKELAHYKAASGMFGSTTTIAMRGKVAPAFIAQWWQMYGLDTPYLQQLAIRILSLTCSASRYEQRWMGKKVKMRGFMKEMMTLHGDNFIKLRDLMSLDNTLGVTKGEGQVGTSTNPSKRAKRVVSKNKGKKVEDVVASEDSSSEKEKLVPNANFIHSDGEKAEGFLNEQHHHVEINYADIDEDEKD